MSKNLLILQWSRRFSSHGLFRFLHLFVFTFFLSSCAASPFIQPQINSLVVAEQFPYALKLLENNEKSYGPQNRLLYLLDYGLVLHLSGLYKESVVLFEEAKEHYDRLYTVSLSNQASTWLINDNRAPYRGEDFERVMINIFQALNFAALDDFEEALVEARDVDLKLAMINRQYKADQKNVYKEDAFARFLMGILYETAGSSADLNDALISYKKAADIYEGDYASQYKTETPEVLKENLLSLAQDIDREIFEVYRTKFPETEFTNFKEKSQSGAIYLVEYEGLSAVKHAWALPIPLPGGYVTKLAFPRYEERQYARHPGLLKVSSGQQTFESETQSVEDISGIAIQNLDNRKARVIARAVLRAAGKYLFEEAREDAIRSHYGNNAGNWFRYLASLYNITSEQPDLRSWQTLPAQIRLTRLILKPGTYKIYFDQKLLKEVALGAGQTKFFIMRSVY